MLRFLDISSNKLTRGKQFKTSYVISEGEDSMYDVDLSGVISLANAIPDMGAISSVNLLMNSIGIEQAQALASILKAHPTLKSLCGNKGDETELDMSGKKMESWDAIMLAPEITDNGAMMSLNLASNNLWAEGAKIVMKAIKVRK
jgi:hypothetical protein